MLALSRINVDHCLESVNLRWMVLGSFAVFEFSSTLSCDVNIFHPNFVKYNEKDLSSNPETEMRRRDLEMIFHELLWSKFSHAVCCVCGCKLCEE